MQQTVHRLPGFQGFRQQNAVQQARSALRLVAKRTSVCPVAAVVAEPATVELKAFDGSAAGTESLALRVAGDTARHVVHRYVVMVRQNARAGTASTKTRSEVRGGGRKPYAQKGTGNARRGSKRSPLLPGGGVVFGPKPKDWSIKMNKKERRLAMATALQSAVSDMVVVEDLGANKFEERKTKSFVTAMRNWGADPMTENCLFILADANENVMLSGRNIEKLRFNTVNALNIYDVLRADKIVLEQSALQHIQSFYGKTAAEETEEAQQ